MYIHQAGNAERRSTDVGHILFPATEQLLKRYHRSDTLREPPPAKPIIFFGRDTVVRGTVVALFRHDHVALIGPGGIGKSCIAKAVLQDDAIKERFKDERFFVRFDDMDASQVTCGTFLNCIANCLGVKVSKGTAREFISFHLSTHQVLLVFDNAETFLEALADRDAAEIATIIDGFGSLSSVTLMLTTRSRSLPPNLLCNHITVLPLSNVPLGITVYHDSIPQAVVHKLLSALDFTPTFHKSAGSGCRAKSVVSSRSGGGLGTGEDLSFGRGAGVRSLAVAVGRLSVVVLSKPWR
jgi:hypothetical protein